MNFETYQIEAFKTALYLEKVEEKLKEMGVNDNAVTFVKQMAGLSYAGLGLGEVGEIQGKLKKIIRDDGGLVTEEKRKELSKELGDALWYIAAACTELNLSMDAVAEENIKKLKSRQERNVLRGSGDNR